MAAFGKQLYSPLGMGGSVKSIWNEPWNKRGTASNNGKMGPNKYNITIRSNLFSTLLPSLTKMLLQKICGNMDPLCLTNWLEPLFFCQVATKISAACFLWLDSIHPSNSSLHSLKSDNLQYNTLGYRVDGPNDSSTKCLIFHVLFFVHNFL